MAARILCFPRPVTFTNAAAGQVGIIPPASGGEGLESDCESEMHSTASESGLGCVRGTTLALAFEAATAMVIYTSWQLLHLLLLHVAR